MSYAPLPAVPQVGIPEWQFQFLNGVKQNIEVLTAQRGDTGFQALIARQVGVRPMGDLNLKQVTATGAGFTISGVQVAGLEDYSKLVVDVQTLIGDVAYIKDVLNALITQLRPDS
jgi:hypothetical protein